MKDHARQLGVLEDVLSGNKKPDSLAEAGLYSIFGDPDMIDLVTQKIEERSALIRELMEMNKKSGFMLLPQIPHDELGAFMAIEALAASNPEAHENLGKIAELDKLRFMVGGPPGMKC